MPQNMEHKLPVNASRTVVAGERESTWLPCREPTYRVLLAIPLRLFIQIRLLLLHRVRFAPKAFRCDREKPGWICGAILQFA